MLKKLILFFILFVSGYLNAQTLYWIGGSGYWNDKSHWSLTSGGKSADMVPSANSTVIFDNASSAKSFTIEALYHLAFKSIIAENTQSDINIVSSSHTDLSISGHVFLNPNFHLNLGGKLYLNPQEPVKYQFSHNKFTDDIYLNAQSTVEMGVLSTEKTLFVSGKIQLKNSVLFAGNLSFTNGQIELDNNTIQVSNRIDMVNASISHSSKSKTRLICRKNELSPSNFKTLSTVPNLKISPLASMACAVSLTNSSDPTCAGARNGTATFDLSGCTNPPYEIQWINTDPSAACQTLPNAEGAFTGTTYTVNNIYGCGQVYTVLFTNSVGEQTAVQVPIINPAPTILSPSYIQPTCFGSTNGQIRTLVISGVSPLTFKWMPSAITHSNIVTRDTLKNVGAGIYTLTATNANGCVNTFTYALNSPTVLLANGLSNSITCNASCNGSATVSPTGGTAPYTYSWLSSSSTPSVNSSSNISNLCPGIVTMTVTDSKSCTATYSANITQPPVISLTASKTNMKCGSICDGTATITATGGLGAFTYSWAPSGGTGATASGLCANIYTVAVNNNINCNKTITVSITSPPTLTASPTKKDVLCFGTSTGTININASGGTPGLTYSWSPSISSISTATNLAAGVYNYTVTDALGCQYPNTLTITQPPASTLTIAGTSLTCHGDTNGSAVSNMSGGTSPYTYSWSPGNPTGQGTGNITNLSQGTYTLRVLDANSCPTTKTVVISQPNAIAVSVASVAPSCNGFTNGVITTTVTGGQTPYTFTLQPASGAAKTGNSPYTNLTAGSYTFIAKDNAGCIKTQTINLVEPIALTLTLTATSLNCFNDCKATVSTLVSGGVPGYSYVWNNGATGTSIINQCAGVYSVTVTDLKNCKASQTVTITAPPSLTVNVTATNPNCNGQSTGVASASVSGGTPNYTINWNNGVIGNTASNLSKGTYTVSVTDSKGCPKTGTVSITTPPALTLTSSGGMVSCAGSTDGTVSVTPTGGTPGYFYSWNSVPSQTTSKAIGLGVGNYIASVTDSKGCVATATAAISQPSVLTPTITNIISSCNVCIGSATGNGIGGTAPYTFSWSPSGQTSSVASNLCVGVQTFVVTDSKGCSKTQTVQISQTVISLITSSGSTLTCNNSNNGIATANASGGASPYTFTWSPAPIQNTQTATGLSAGSHTVIVADSKGCTNTSVVNFTNPPALTLTVTKSDLTCHNICNGTAKALATGGTGALSYRWMPGGATTSSLTGLCAGVYTVTVTDNNSCSLTQTLSITQPSSLTASFSFTTPNTCITSDGTINAQIAGGTSPYTFTWSPVNSSSMPLTNAGAGTYSLQIRDAASCTRTVVTSLNNPTGPTVTVQTNSLACFGSSTGSATLSISGSAPFTVSWPSISSTNTVVTGLSAGVYLSTITDANSCVTNQTINIASPSQFTISGVVNHVACHSTPSGSINLTPSGGTGAYTYTWLPTGGSVQDPNNLSAGTYSVLMSDANGCQTSSSFTLTEPSPLSLTFRKKDVQCHGGISGGARVIVSGGTNPYTYSWTPTGTFVGSPLDTVVNLSSVVYTVNIRDAANCIITGTVEITQPTALSSSITVTHPKCSQQSTGSATIQASGGTSPYTYAFNTTPPALTQTVSGLAKGTYIGIITDANGCPSASVFDITEPLPIVVTTTVSSPKCNGVCSGNVTTAVSGGSPNYLYQWIPNGGNVSNANGLCAGNYTVIVTDQNSCSGQALITLTEPDHLIANTSFTNPSCFGFSNGVISSSPLGGTAPFSFQWLGTAQTTQTLSNVPAGDYTLSVTDFNQCKDTQIVKLINPNALSINPSKVLASCDIDNGSIDASAAIGQAPFTYNWLPPILPAQSTNTVVNNLGAGIYTVVLTDASACSATVAIALSNADGPTGATITSTNVTCMRFNNGMAEVSNPIGGTAPYTLGWRNPSSTLAFINQLAPGTYMAQIVDANNCKLFKSVDIIEPQAIDDNEHIVSAICMGNCSGSIDVKPTGGNTSYSYLWSNGAITQTVTNLCPGSISVTITDNLNCTYTTTYTIPSLTTITTNTFAIDNICFGKCEGQLEAVNIAGGQPPYSFHWSDPLGQATSAAANLCSENYSITIKDANGCFNVWPGNISSPAQITFTPVVTQPGCDLCNGSVTISPTGGKPTYSYLWSTNETGNTTSNLCAGVYEVKIMDNNQCASTSKVIINSSSSITGETIQKADVNCQAACNGSVSIVAIGGSQPISYNWLHNGSSSQTLTNLCEGIYYCNMTDAEGCTRTASVAIGAVTVLTITPKVTQTSCTSSTGSISVSVSGGTGSYTYSWLPSGNSSSIKNLSPGHYTLTVSDGNCPKTEVFTINAINSPVITSKQTSISCANSCDGKIEITISGGIPNYTTAWSNGATNTSITQLCAGNYSVEVTDAGGCKAIKQFYLKTVSPVTFNVPDLDIPKCDADCNGSLIINPIGGTMPYTYTWLPSNITTPLISNLCAGNYSITVTDAHDCQTTKTYSLVNPPTLLVTATATNVSCNTATDGSIDLTVSGGIAPYTYTWTPSGASTEDQTNIAAGTYTILLLDDNGCLRDSVFEIKPTIVVQSIAGNDTTFCEKSSFALNGTKSSGGNSFEWFELPSGSIISSTLTGVVKPAVGTNTYVLSVKNGVCADHDTIVVTSLSLPTVDAGPVINMPILASMSIGGNPTSSDALTYTWTPNMALSDPNVANPTTSASITTIYTITVSGQNGCLNSDSVTVFVFPEIRIPNGFSPNGDGKNDVWEIDLIYQFPDSEVEVFNRWGERLFYSKGYAVPFNGQYQGKDLPVGTYYYVIKLNHPDFPNAYTSPLTIFR